MTKQIKIKQEKEGASCADKTCPFHGSNAVKLRGRTFEGEVTSKLHGRVKIEFDRFLYDRKYERFEKRKTKLHARLPDCLKEIVQIGDWIEIKECRKLSKIISFYVTRKIRSKHEQKQGEGKK